MTVFKDKFFEFFDCHVFIALEIEDIHDYTRKTKTSKNRPYMNQ